MADFGIALAVSSAGGGSRMTETGMSLGTPHYMSPEQAMGEREITARRDVYALGAMTYEMLVGEPPFTGPTAQAIVAKVMTAEPAGLTAQRRSVPAEVEDAVLTALAEAAGRPVRHRGGVRGGARRPGAARPRRARTACRTGAAPPRRSARRSLYVVGAVAAIATAAALLLGLRARRQPALPVTRMTLDIPDLRVNFTGFYGTSLAISRDGSRMAFVTRAGENVTRLVVRDRADIQPRLLTGTDGGDAPFFSPDGQWIGYFAGGALYKVAAAGGTPVRLAERSSLSAAERTLARRRADRVYRAGLRRHGRAVGGRQSSGPGADAEVGCPRVSRRDAAEGRAAAHPLRQHLRRPGGGGDQPQDPGGGHHPHRGCPRLLPAERHPARHAQRRDAGRRRRSTSTSSGSPGRRRCS